MSKQLAVPAKRALPPKEGGLFKELLGYYETRSLKKGVKTADQILKKFPEHAETLCMKGLLLTHMGKREEGIDLVKKGVRLDLTSHICWHVFGLIQKGEKKYDEALKSYIQALKFDRENLNILLDAANLQVHLRIFDSLVETRHTILRLRPNVRKHWIGYALAHHLNGNPLEARKILQHYQIMVKGIPDHDVEHSETLLYLVRVHEELAEFDEALRVLDTGEQNGQIVDRTAVLEARARILSKLKSDESEAAWRVLIDYNPDSYEYYRGYLSNRGINLDDRADSEAALKILINFSTELPKAAAPRRLALNVASGDSFKDLAGTYIRSGLTRGIPSLFADLKALYRDEHKKTAVEEIVEAEHTKHAAEQSTPSEDSEPTTYLWTLYFLAQHYSHLGQYSKALGLLETALTHTPTLPELYTCKARLLKRAGDPIGAAKLLDEARLLDGQDRFLNTKCAKYMLRAGFIEQGNQILGLFTKKDAPSPGSDLEDMQSLLYLEEEADAQYQSGKLHLALKKYMAIQKLFDEVEDDQYDFHGYALRRFTITIYLNLLTWEDQLRSHPSYIKAALHASKIFIAVHDEPALAITDNSEPLTDAEKKAKKKAKKAQKAHEDPKKLTQGANANEDKGLEVPQAKDEDPDGKKLLASPDPLEMAAKFLSPLASLAPGNIDAWIALYDIAIRRKKLLQAIRALKHAKSLDPESPELHIRIIDFALRASDLPQTPPAPIGPLFTSFHSSLFPSLSPSSDSSNPFSTSKLSLETLNSQYLQKHSNSPLGILAVAKVQHRLGSPVGQVEETIFSSLGKGDSGEGLVGFNIKVASRFIEFLASIKSTRVVEYRSACAQRFELSTIFRPIEELNALRTSVVWPAPQAVSTEVKDGNTNGGVDGYIAQ
ncbi:NMDA receptor-regulated protein 1a [Pluteus cervinus]|uniref:NMDA receptor-regulated protein 1a n=1 Tax=Pluteus cervinus TaxID=181527 RepID=A0ACD3A9B2_9AGAR|nr:NMDA receptor-regulated protein 1a [Pluteus cervinus]